MSPVGAKSVLRRIANTGYAFGPALDSTFILTQIPNLYPELESIEMKGICANLQTSVFQSRIGSGRTAFRESHVEQRRPSHARQVPSVAVDHEPHPRPQASQGHLHAQEHL